MLLVKNYVLADPLLNTYPQSQVGADLISQAMNVAAVPEFFVYRTDALVIDIYDQITWANFTPNDLPPVAAIPSAPTTAETYALDLWRARSLQCQGKQFNLQTMLMGRIYTNAAKASIRAGLQDALTAIPSGAAGVNRSGGWANVQTALYRKAVLGEKIVSTGTGSAASPATMPATGEGTIGLDEIMAIMGWTYL